MTFFYPASAVSGVQPCPICSAGLPGVPRYPHYLCDSCCARAVDDTGRSLVFSNVTLLGGGFRAQYVDSGEERQSDICFVDGVRCLAREGYFGGIVVQPVQQ